MKWILWLSVMLLNTQTFASANVGEKAPDFKLMGSDGREHSLTEGKGKVVVLEWFNAGCPFVRKHYNAGLMQDLQSRIASKDVLWFTIASSAKGKQGHLELNELKAMHDEKKMANTALLGDPKSDMARAYQAKTTPHMFVIDKKGVVAYNGAIDSEDSAKATTLTEYKANKEIKHYLEDAVVAVKADRKPAVTAKDPYGCSVKY